LPVNFSGRFARYFTSVTNGTNGTDAPPKPRLLVWGGNGALGQSIIKAFQKIQWETVSVDYVGNKDATTNVLLAKNKNWKDNALHASSAIGQQKFEAMVNTAGAWVGGSIKDDMIFEQFDLMVQFNAKSAIALSHLATKHLADGGSLILTGAAAALEPCQSMLAYGLSKQIVHSLVTSMSDSKNGLGVKNAVVVGILPVTIDTETNRKAMPGSDVSGWTPPEHFAERIVLWLTSKAQGKKPVNGSLYKFSTSDNRTSVRRTV